MGIVFGYAFGNFRFKVSKSLPSIHSEHGHFLVCIYSTSAFAFSALADTTASAFTSENPSVGLILCAKKDDAVVEYAFSRSQSPTLVSDYLQDTFDIFVLHHQRHRCR